MTDTIPLKAAVAIPVYRAELNQLEQFSLSRCVAMLGRYPMVFFGPQSLNYAPFVQQAPTASKLHFPDECFSSTQRYSELLLSRSFYEEFVQFDYVLIHQLDAFVFRDALYEWCCRGYDYVGAPWVQEDGHWLGVGNGGFSLRRVVSCLAVLKSVHREFPNDYWAMMRQVLPGRWRRALRYPKKIKRQLGLRDDVNSFLRRFIQEGRPEDMFWGLHAVRFYRCFRVAAIKEALEFSVEGGLTEIHGYYAARPPFGCHKNRFLSMISRYLAGTHVPESQYESLVWNLARKAGLLPQER
jgi:hypothetical protein